MVLALLLTAVLGQGSTALVGPSRAAFKRSCVLDADCGAGRACNSGVCASTDFFTMMASTTTVGTVADNLCTGFASELVGNYLCSNGNGTGTNTTMTANGAASTVSVAVCPNSTDCNDVSAMRVGSAGTATYTTSTFTPPAGDFSVCETYRIPAADTGFLINKQGAFAFRVDTGAMYVDIYNPAATGTFLNIAAGQTPGAWAFNCLTYDYVSDGTSIARLYANGQPDDVDTAAVGPIGTGTTAITIGSVWNNTQPQNADVRQVFYTEKILSAATILAMDNAVRIKLKGDAAEAVTMLRSSSDTCARSDGVVTILEAHEPCVASLGYQVFEERSNQVLRNDALGHAAWTATNTTVTANGTRAPTSQLTADSLESTSSGGFIESTAFAIVGTTATASIFSRVAASTQAGAIVLRDTTAGADKCTATFTSSTTWTRRNCSATVISGNDHVLRIYPGGTAGTGTTIFWGAQTEVGESASPVAITAGTVSNRAADNAETEPEENTVNTGCWAATATFTDSTTDNARILAFPSEGNIRASGTPPNTIIKSDGTNNANPLTTGALSGNTVHISAWWNSGTLLHAVYRDGVQGTPGVFDGNMTLDTALQFGVRGGGNHMNGWLKNIRLGTDPNGCLQ